MSRLPRLFKSLRKQTIIFQIASLIAGSIVLGSGTLKGQDPLRRFEDISAVPMNKRRSAFSDASPNDRSDIVRIHLALYLAKHLELSEDQKQIILQGISLASPELYGASSTSPDSKAKADDQMKQFQNRVLAVFKRDDMVKLFSTLGPPETQDDLLQKYRDVSALPMRERKTAFRKAPPKDRSDLWRTHMALYLANHPELNEAQKNVILDAMSLAVPSFFEMSSVSSDSRPKVEESLRFLENRAGAVFSKDEGGKIFATLGDPEPPKSVSSLERSRPNRTTSSSNTVGKLNRFVEQDLEIIADCSCSHQSDWCSTVCGGNNCTTSTWGCGSLWAYPCTGICYKYLN